MEISNIEYNDGKHRLSLDSIENSETEFRFAWRGNEISKDAFVNRPAHFEWEALGKLIRKGFDSGKIKPEDMDRFLYNLIGIKK